MLMVDGKYEYEFALAENCIFLDIRDLCAAVIIIVKHKTGAMEKPYH